MLYGCRDHVYNYFWTQSHYAAQHITDHLCCSPVFQSQLHRLAASLGSLGHILYCIQAVSLLTPRGQQGGKEGPEKRRQQTLEDSSWLSKHSALFLPTLLLSEGRASCVEGQMTSILPSIHPPIYSWDSGPDRKMVRSNRFRNASNSHN